MKCICGDEVWMRNITPTTKPMGIVPPGTIVKNAFHYSNNK